MESNYHATAQEVIDLIEGFSKQGEEGRVSLNETAKQAYSEAICNSVAKMPDNDWERLSAYIKENFKGIARGGNGDIFTILKSPRILSGELSLPQIRDIWNFIN
jgi:hypothetical protein